MRVLAMVGVTSLALVSLVAVAGVRQAPVPVLQPQDVAPNMTATMSPPGMSTNENSFFFRTISIYDQDKALKTANNEIITIPGGTFSFVYSCPSSSTTPIFTKTSENTNTGQWIFSVASKSKHVDRLFDDSYTVVDHSSMVPGLNDANVNIGQQVAVVNVP